MKKMFLTIGLCAMFGAANAESDKSEQAVNLVAGILASENVEVLSQKEMQDTKAGAIYWEHESIKGNVTADSTSTSGNPQRSGYDLAKATPL